MSLKVVWQSNNVLRCINPLKKDDYLAYTCMSCYLSFCHSFGVKYDILPQCGYLFWSLTTSFRSTRIRSLGLSMLFPLHFLVFTDSIFSCVSLIWWALVWCFYFLVVIVSWSGPCRRAMKWFSIVLLFSMTRAFFIFLISPSLDFMPYDPSSFLPKNRPVGDCLITAS